MNQHILPRWFEWWQDHVVLSLLVVAGMILNGLMFAHGIVANLEDPASWGVFHGVIFAAFFAAGSGLTGVALRASATMGRAARERRWGLALVNLLVSLLFLPLEFWASVTERSLTRVFTPADAWVLQLLGHPEMPVSPTIVAIALASPLILFSWGIVTSPAEETSASDIAAEAAKERARLEAELLLEPLRAQKRAMQARGLRSVVAAAAGREDTSPVVEAIPAPSSASPETPTRGPTGPGSPARASKRRTSGTKRPGSSKVIALRSMPAEERIRTIAAQHPTISVRALAKRADVSESTASKWLRVIQSEQAQAVQ